MARKPLETRQLTALDVERHTADAASTQALNDGGGLYLRKSGSKWYWYFRSTSPVTGQRAWLPLCNGNPYASGRTASTSSLAAARIEAETHRVKVRAGADLKIERQQRIDTQRAAIEQSAETARRALTVRSLFTRWQDTDLKLVVKGDKRSGRKDSGLYAQQQFERHVFPQIGDVHAPDVQRADVMALLDKLKTQGSNRTANVILALLRQMFRFAAKRDLVQGDPTFGIEKKDAGGKDNERERVLKEQEIRELARKVPTANLNPRTEAALWLLLATAARVGELVKTKWIDIDTTARTWTIPPENSKNGKAHVVHLSDFAMYWIDRLSGLRSNPTWVFPNVSETDHVCTKTLNKQFSDRQRDGKPMSNRASNTTALALPGGKWVPHDLRRTAATRMQALGVSSDIIDRCLNHSEANKVTRTYQRDELLPQRKEAFDVLGAHLDVLAIADENVITLTSRRA